MTVEVLISTMNQIDASLIDNMNLKTDAVIINQTNNLNEEIIFRNEKKIRIYSFPEKGVGRSRNHALMKAEGDICIFADDDVIYVADYEKLILEGFRKYPDADVLIFNVESLNKERPINRILKEGRVNYLNYMRHGACRIAFKREAVLKSNIFFSLMFGGGATYGCGEDTLFLSECLKKGLKIYTYLPKLADVKQEDSTWFTGINKKFYVDKGALFAAISKRYSVLLITIFALKWYKDYKESFSLNQVIRYMNIGRKKYQYKEIME